jgi:hypothetical protein
MFLSEPSTSAMLLTMLCAGCCLPGYNHPVDEVLDSLLDCLDHPALPLLQWKEEMSFVESRLPAGRRAAGCLHPVLV